MMFNKPNQNCEFGCSPNNCEHARADQNVESSILGDEIQLDFLADSYFEFSDWLSNELEALEKRYDTFTTFASVRKYMHR